VNDERSRDDDEKPRRSFWATVPRRTAARVFLLLLLLLGVIVLQRKAGDIASCANRAFMLPQPGTAGAAGGGVPAPGHIRARVVLPEKPAR